MPIRYKSCVTDAHGKSARSPVYVFPPNYSIIRLFECCGVGLGDFQAFPNNFMSIKPIFTLGAALITCRRLHAGDARQANSICLAMSDSQSLSVLLLCAVVVH